MSDQIKVAIKVRPLIEREQLENQAWSVLENTIFQIDPSTGKRKGDTYKFDHIFDTFSRNEDVFETVVKPLVDAAVGGFNATIFAYGQTSSGKTYTMSGDKTEPGVIQLAVSHMFEAMKQSSGREFLARASYLEIYNEKVQDLLGSDKTTLQIREVDGNVVVSDLKEEIVADVSKTIHLMKKGERKRHVGETAMNEKSSRSHSIFRFIIESRVTDEGDSGAIQVSQLNFVDLAGSERVNQTGAQGERLKEGCSINRSLFMLGHVISQLSEGQRSHINFRDSKLTRILQPSLGGNALTVIICTVTPAAIEETHCTLGFASRAKNIKNEPHLNEVLSDGTLLKRYARQLSKLKAELEEAKASNFAQEVEAMENKLEEKDKHNRLLQARIDLLTEKLISGVTTKDRKYAFQRRRTWCAPSGRLSFVPLSLATIEEVPSPCTKRVDILESSLTSQFQIPLEEFELQLLSAEVESVSSEPSIMADVCESPESRDISIDTVLSCPYVTSRSKRKRYSIDQVKSSVGICHAGCQTDPIAISPEHTCNNRSTNETPPNELRKRVSFWKGEHDLMTMEYNELRYYTRLESDCIRKIHEELEKSRQEVIKTKEENDQLKKELFDEKVKAEMRIHELEELNHQSNKRWETLDMEFLSDVPTTPDGKQLKQLQEENTRYNEIIAEKETAIQLLEEQLTHMSIVIAEINDSKNSHVESTKHIVSQKDKEILFLQEEMSSLRADQEADKQELVRLRELVDQSFVIIEDKDKMILHLEDKLSCLLSDSSADEIVSNELKRLNTTLLEKNKEILALQDQISLLNANFSNEKIIMLQHEITEREQRICNLEEQLTSLPSNTATKEIVDNLKTKITDLESMMLEKNKLTLDLEEQLSLTTKATGEKSKIRELRKEITQCSLAEKEQQIIELEESLLHSSSTTATATETINKLENEISNLKNIISEKTEKLIFLQEKISLLNVNAGDEKLQVSTLSEEIAHLSLMIKKKDQRIIDLEERLLHASSVPNAAETLIEMENEIVNLKNVISDKNREILVFQDQIGCLSLKIDGQRKEVVRFDEEAAEHTATIKDNGQNILDMKEQLACMSSPVTTMKSVNELENEIVRLKNIISDKDREILALQSGKSLITIAGGCEEEAIVLQQEMDQHYILKEKDQRNVKLEPLCHTSSDSLYIEIVTELEKEVAHLKNVVSEKNGEILVLQDQISSFRNSANDRLELNRLQEEIASYSVIIKDKDQRIIDLKEQVSQMSSILSTADNVPKLETEKISRVADLSCEMQGSSMSKEITLVSIGKKIDQTSEDMEEQLFRISLSEAFNSHEIESVASFVRALLSERDHNIKALETHIMPLNTCESEEICILEEELPQRSAVDKENEQRVLYFEQENMDAHYTTTNNHCILGLDSEISKMNAEEVVLQEQTCVLNTNSDQEDLCRLQQEVGQWSALTEEKEHIILHLEKQLNVCCETDTEQEAGLVNLNNTVSQTDTEMLSLKQKIMSLSVDVTFEKQESDRLREEITRWCAIVKEKDETIKDLEEHLSVSSVSVSSETVNKLQAEIDSLKNILFERNNEVQAFEEHKRSLTADMTIKKAEVSKLEEELARLSTVIGEKEQKILDLELQLKNTLSSTTDNKFVHDLEHEISNLKTIISEKDEKNTVLQEQIYLLHTNSTSEKQELDRLKEEVIEMSAVNEEKERIIINLKEQLSVSCETVKELESGIANLTNAVSQKDIEVVSLREKIVSLNADMTFEKKQETDRLQEEITCLCAIIKEKDELIKGLEEQLSVFLVSVSSETENKLKAEIDSLKNILSERNNEVQAFEEHKRSLTADMTIKKAEVSKLEEELARMSTVIGEKEQKILDLELELRNTLSSTTDNKFVHDLEHEISNLKAIISEKDEKNTILQEQISMLHTSSTSEKQELDKLKEDVIEMSAVTEEKELIIIGLKEELSVSSETVRELESRIANLTNAISQKETDVLSLREKILCLSDDMTCEQKETDTLKEVGTQWCTIIKERDETIKGLEEPLLVSCLSSETVSKLQAEIDSLKNILSERNNEIQAFEEHKRSLIADMTSKNEEVSRLEEELAKMSTVIEEKEQKILNLELDLRNTLSSSSESKFVHDLEYEISNLKTIISEKDKKNTVLQDQINVLHTNNASEKQELGRQNEEVIQMSAITKENEHIITVLKEQLSISCETVKQLESRIANLTNAVSQKDTELMSLKEKILCLSDGMTCEKNETATLREEMTQCYTIVKEKDETIKGLEEQLSVSCLSSETVNKLQAEIDGLKNILSVRNNEVQAFEEHKRSLTADITIKKAEVSKLEEELARMSTVIGEKEQKILDLELELRNTLSSTIDNKFVHDLEHEISNLKAIISEKDEKNTVLQEQISMLPTISISEKQELDRLKEEVIDLSAVTEEKERIIINLKEQLSVSCETVKELESGIANLTNAVSQKDIEVVSSREKILSLNADMTFEKKQETDRLQEEITRLCAIVKDKDEIIKRLEEQLSLSLVSVPSETVNKLQAEIGGLKNILSERNNEVQAFEEHKRSLTADMTSKNVEVSKLEEELAKMSTVIREKEQKILDLELELRNTLSSSSESKCVHDLEHENSNLKAIISEKDEKNTVLQEQIYLLHTNSTSEKQELDRLKEEVIEMSAVNEEKERIIINLKEQLSVSCEMVKELESGIANLTNAVSQKDIEVVSLREKIVSLNADMNFDKKQETDRLQEEITRLCAIVKEKDELIKGLEEQLSVFLVSVSSETENKLQAEIDSLKNILSERNNEVQAFEEHKRSLTAAMTSKNVEVSKLEEELAKMSTVIREKEQKILDLELELKNTLSSTTDNKFVHDLEHEISNLKAIISEKDEKNTVLQEQIYLLHTSSTSEKQELDRLKEEVIEMSAVTEEKERIIINLKEQLSVSCEAVKELESGIANLTNAVSQKDIEVVSLREKIVSLNADMTFEKKQETDRLQEEITCLCAIVKEKDELIKGLEEQLSVFLVSVSSETENKLQAEIDSLKNILSERNNEIQAFEEHKRSLTADMTIKKAEVSKLEEELARMSTVIGEKEQKILDLKLELRNTLSSTTDNKFVHDLEHEISNLKAIISEKDEKNTVLQEQISMLHTSSTSKKQELDRLKEEVIEMSAVTEEKELIIIGLKEQLSVSCETVKELESGIANLTNAVSQKDTEILALKEKISSLNIDVSNEKQKADRLLEEVAQWSATVSKNNLVQNLEEKLSERSSLEAEIVNLKNIVSNKNNENIALKEQIDILKTDTASDKQELGILKGEVAQLLAAIEEKEHTIVEEQLSVYCETMKELEVSNANLNVVVSLKDIEIPSLKEKLSSLDAVESSERQETLRLQEEIAQGCAVDKEKDQTIGVLEEQVLPSTLINNDYVNNHEIEINNLKTILSGRNNEIAVLKERISSLQTDLANRMLEISKLEEEIIKKSAVTREKEQIILDLEEQFRCMPGEITSRHVFDTGAEIVNWETVASEKNEVHVLDEHISLEASVADNQKHKRLKEETCSLQEKRLPSRSSLSVQDKLKLLQGQIDEKDRAIYLMEQELSNLSKKLGEESEMVKNLQHENKAMEDKLIETVEHRKHLVSEILGLNSKFDQDSLEEYQLSELLNTFCSCIIQKEEEVLSFQIQQHELLVEENHRLTSHLECLESELLEKEEEYKNLHCAYDDVKVAKDTLIAEVEKKMSHLNSVKDDLLGARKEMEQLNSKLSSHETFKVTVDKLLKNLSTIPELNVNSGNDVLQAVNKLIHKFQNPQTVKDLKWIDCLKEIFEGDNEVKKCLENIVNNKQNLENEKEDIGHVVENKASNYSLCGDSVAKCHLTNDVQEINVDSARVFEIASEIDLESNLGVVIRFFMQKLISAEEYTNKNSILTEQLSCMKQQNELLKRHLDSLLLGMEERKKELKAMENIINEIPAVKEVVMQSEEIVCDLPVKYYRNPLDVLLSSINSLTQKLETCHSVPSDTSELQISDSIELMSNTKENNSYSLPLNINSSEQGNKPVLNVVHELHSEEHTNNNEWKTDLLKDDETEKIAMKMKLLNKLEEDMNKIRELLASVKELDVHIDIVSSVDMLIKNLRRSWEITEEVSGLRAENISLRKEMTILKSDIRDIELMLYSIQDKEVNSDLAVEDKCSMKDGHHLKDMLNAKVQIVKEMEKADRDISEILSSVPELDLGNGTVNAVQVLVQNFMSSKHFTQKMNKLEDEISFFKNENMTFQERLECLNLDLQGKREECNYLQNLLSSEQAQVKTLEGEISHYSECMKKLEIDARKIFELSALEPGLDHQNSVVTACAFVLEKLHTAQKLNEDKFQLEVEFAKVRKENEDMKREIDELKHDVQNKKEEVFKTQREIESKQMIANEVQCIEILKQELEALKRDQHDFEKESSKHELLLVTDPNSPEDLVLAVKFLFQTFKTVKDSTRENLKLNKTLHELKQENNKLKENLESLTSEIQEVRENNNDLMKSLCDVQATKEMLLLEMKETVSSKQFEIKALKDALNCKSAILKTMEDDNAKINMLLSSCPEFSLKTDTISCISAMIKRLQFCKENHEIKLKDENVFLRKENDAMQKQIVLLKSDIESQKQTSKHLSETVHTLQTRIEISSKELKESSNWKSFKEEIMTKAQCLEMTMEPDLIEIYEEIMNIPELDFPRNLIPLVTLLTDKLANQDLKNRALSSKLDFQNIQQGKTLEKIVNYEKQIYQMDDKIENLSIAVAQEKERAENLQSEKTRLQEELDGAVAALTEAKKQLFAVSTAREKLQTAEKWLAEREEVITKLRLAEKQFSDLGYKRQGDIIIRVGSKCSPYQIGSSAKLRIKELEGEITELRRELLKHQEGASGRSLVSVGVNTQKGNECDNCLGSDIEIRNLKFQIMGHKSKVQVLKDQIEREELKYKEDVEVFERKLAAAKSKNGELKMEIRRLQAAQEVSFVAGARKKQQPAVNVHDQQIQTDSEADVVYRLSGEGSGIVNDYVVTVYKEKVKKLLHENELLKELNRRRLHKIRLLQGQLPAEDKEEMENFESRKENTDCNVNGGKISDTSTHKRKKPASSSHS